MSRPTRSCARCGAGALEASRFCPGCGLEFLAIAPGEILDAKYEILDKLAEGGMGEVYRARHIHLEEIRVIKVMKAGALEESGRERRFADEARLATRIRHPNIAALYDFARLSSGVYYMVWEFIDGQTLLQVLRRSGRLPPDVAIDIALQVLDGLAELHRTGVVHRDVSPDNIMIVDRDGRRRLKIIDLGIAKRISRDDDGLTSTGMFMGKLKYCSPEQAGSIAAGESIDGRSDLYSFGAVLYEMLSGAPVFDAPTPEGYLAKHIKEPPPPLDVSHLPAEIGAPLAAIVAKALRKDRTARFRSAEEFASALAAIRVDTGTLPTVAQPALLDRGVRAGRAMRLAAGASLAIGALAIGYAIWRGRPLHTPPIRSVRPIGRPAAPAPAPAPAALPIIPPVVEPDRPSARPAPPAVIDASAESSDSSKSLIEHRPIAFARRFEPIPIEARWPGAPPDLTGSIFFRRGRFGPWMSVPLAFVGDRISGQIPGAAVRPRLLAYFLEVSDFKGNVRRFGSRRDPTYVRVGRRR